MLKVGYTREFIRLYEKLTPELRVETKRVIELFRNKKNHTTLRVHKLHGKQAGLLSFEVNYSHRIIFEYLETSKKNAVLLRVGNHSIYE